MAFFLANSGSPDVIGGVTPGSYKAKCVNRSGSSVVKGEVVMLDMAASATEITTNDSNSYLPGAGDASGDSVWNTVINPAAANIQNGGTFFGVCLDVSVADNAVGEFQFFGIVDEAFVTCSNAGGLTGDDPLTVVAGAAGRFDGIRDTNERIVAWYLDSQDSSLTTRELKRIFLHNGVFGGTAAGTAVS